MLRGKSQKELIHLSRQLIQPLLPSFHKGQSGKIAVIGGNEDYTGAPFFQVILLLWWGLIYLMLFVKKQQLQ